MPVREVEYQGLTLKAAAFEVVGTGLFIVLLAIVVNAGEGSRERLRLIELPATNAWFGDADEALQFALDYGQAVIDGDVPDHSPADP